MHCLRWRTTDPAVEHADIPVTAPISALGLLISRPAEGGRLSWPEHTVGSVTLGPSISEDRDVIDLVQGELHQIETSK